MQKKPLIWKGSSFEDIKNDKIFPLEARKEAGYQLDRIQSGLDPEDWKPFNQVGPGTREIRISLGDGWYRVMYVAKFPEAVYVLHCFSKKSRATSHHDKEITSNRYKAMIKERNSLT